MRAGRFWTAWTLGVCLSAWGCSPGADAPDVSDAAAALDDAPAPSTDGAPWLDEHVAARPPSPGNEASTSAKPLPRTSSPRSAAESTPAAEELAEHRLMPALRIAEKSRAALDDIRDYVATFSKQELVGTSMLSQTMSMKLREKPFSVYLKYGGKQAGREVLFVEGKNKGNLLVKEAKGVAAWVGPISLSPTSSEVMRENRYPITRIGMARTLDVILEQWRNETKYVEPTVTYYPQARLGETPCLVIESRHARKYRQFPYCMTRLFIEQERQLPIRIEQYGWPAKSEAEPPLVELYMYTDVEINVGLTDKDFDPANPAYNMR